MRPVLPGPSQDPLVPGRRHHHDHQPNCTRRRRAAPGRRCGRPGQVRRRLPHYPARRRPRPSWSPGPRPGRAAPPSPSTPARGPARTCAWTAPAGGPRRPAPPPRPPRPRSPPSCTASALTWPTRPPPAADVPRLAAFLDGHPGWSAFWDKRYGLWRAAEDDPGSVLYAETPVRRRGHRLHHRLLHVQAADSLQRHARRSCPANSAERSPIPDDRHRPARSRILQKT